MAIEVNNPLSLNGDGKFKGHFIRAFLIHITKLGKKFF